MISVRRSLAWMGLSQAGLFVIGFGSSVAMARLLTPREMGIFTVAAAVVGVVSTLRAFGLNTLMIREAELPAPVIRTIFTVNAALNLLCAVLVLSVSEVGARFFGDEGVRSVLRLLAVTPLINALEFLPGTQLERSGAFRAIALVGFCKTLLNAGLTLSLAVAGFSYMSIAWGSLVTTLFSAACMNAIGWRFVSLRPGLHDWRRVSRFGMQMMTIGAVGTMTSKLTDLMIGRIISLPALGLYSRAMSLNSLLWDNLHLVIARVAFVDLAEQHRRKLPLRNSYLRIVAILTASLWPAFTGLAILAGPVVTVIYGEDWIEAAVPLSMLSIAGVFYVAITMTHEIYTVSGEMDRQLRVEFKRNVAGSAMFALGCLAGLAGAAASRIGDALFTIVLVKDDLKRMTQTRASDYTPIYVQSAGLTVLACGPAAVLMTVNGWSEHTSLPAVFGSVFCGVCAWGLGLWHLRHPIYREAVAAGRHLLGLVASGV